MLPPLADFSELVDRLDPPPVGAIENTRAEAALFDASTAVRAFARTSWVVDGELVADVPDIVVVVTLRAARRLYVNPDMVRQESLADHSATFGGELAILTDDDKRDISSALDHPPGLWTLGTTRLELETQSVYVDVAGSDKPLPVEDRILP